MIEMMGGNLKVESTPKVGSKFSFNLIFDTIEISEEIAAKRIIINDLEKPIFEGEILVCEDNPMNQQVIREHLSRVGLRTILANNGSEGVDIVHRRMLGGKKRFDIIFMDIHMPVMDGLEAASKITAMNTGTPIVAMTANVMTNEKILYKENGMPDCVGKPFTSHDLWRCLLRYLVPVEMKKINESPHDESNDKLQKMLQTHFAKHNQEKFEEIANAVGTGDIKLAHRLAHTLKGNAGQLGKTSLQKAAAKIEALLKDGKNMVTEEHLNVLQAELTAVLNELAPMAVEAPPLPEKTTIVFNREKAQELADRLESLLKKGSPESIKLIDEIRVTIPASEELVEQIEDFEFETALSSLAKLTEKWS
jgi:CheY-like chemotaxis protein